MTDKQTLLALAERVERRLKGFCEAVDQLPVVSGALDSGHQFNAFDSADNDETTPDDECEMLVCLGPIGKHRLVCRVEGRAEANMIADALTLASCLRARAGAMP